MPNKSYGMFCPIAMACEVVEPRWTLLILAEMWLGATRFNEIRRGVPGISPTLLSKRLKQLEAQGLIERLEDRAKGTVDYVRTVKAVELEPVLELLGDWGYRHAEPEVALNNLKADYLMWNLRRQIDPSALPDRRVVVRFHFPDCKNEESTFWLVVRPGVPADLCLIDPGFDVDLFVEADLRALGSAWMGYSSLQTEIAEDRLLLTGDPVLTRTIDRWLVKAEEEAAG
jgi:DNA-binding HxlR family transcriptional regulator